MQVNLVSPIVCANSGFSAINTENARKHNKINRFTIIKNAILKQIIIGFFNDSKF
jgi:hypothetical protein